MFGGAGEGGIPVWEYFRNSLIISITSTIIALTIGMAWRLRLRALQIQGQVGDLPGVHADARSARHRTVIAAIHDLCPRRHHRYPFRDDPYLRGVERAIHDLADRRAFFRQVPKDLAEAAQIDGCTRWQAFWQVEFPLAGPGIASAGIFAFLTSWNEYALASQITRSVDSKTLPVGLLDYTSEFADRAGSGICALAVVMIIPALTLTFIIQKHLVSGLTFGAVKG